MGAPVLVVNVLDHLLAPVVLDVEVDVWRLGALLRDEPLEQEPHPHRVDRRDAEAVADRRVRRRSPPLTEDAVRAAELDDLPHREEVAWVVEGIDEGEFLLELPGDVGRDRAAVAMPRPLEGEVPQPLGGGCAVGEALGRVAIAKFGQGEGAAVGHLAGAGDSGGIVGEERREGVGRLEGVLSVGSETAARGRDGDAVADRGEDVL